MASTIVQDLVQSLGLEEERSQKIKDLCLQPKYRSLIEEVVVEESPAEDSTHAVNHTSGSADASANNPTNGFINGHSDAHSGAQVNGTKDAPTSSTKLASLASEVSRIVFEKSGAWIGPSSAEYIPLCESNWSATCHMYPRCILQPSNANEVAQALKVLRKLKTPFAIRSGGHNPNRGWANAGGDAIVIDMNKICNVDLSEDKKTLTFGPGRRWKYVYEALHGTGVAVIGGRTGDVGIGGLILGGGLPSFSSEFGLVCDNVQSFEIVLADSSIVNASRTQNSDLFWALKGGGSNFGVVTQFTFKTVPVDKIWFEARLYDPSSNDKIFEAIEEWQKVAENDPKGSIVHHIGHGRTLLGWIYSEPIEYPSLFKMFYDIPYHSYFVQSTTGTVLDFSRNMSKVLGPPKKMRRNDFGIATRPSAEFYKLAYAFWRKVSDRLFVETGCDMGMGIQPLTTSAMKFGSGEGGNALNTAVEPQQWTNSLTQWVDEKDDEKVLSAVYEFGDYLRETATRMGILLPFIFMNNATTTQDPITGYGTTHVERLKEVSRKYDPEQVFQVLQTDGFLLRKVK